MRPLLPLAALVLGLVAGSLAQQVALPQPAGSLTRTLPFSLVGKLVFSQGDGWFQGSGTVVRPAAVLTAAHNLWDPERGFSTEISFQRALDGETSAGTFQASRIYVLGGYRDSARRNSAADPRAFAHDLGLVLFPEPVAAGAAAGWWAYPAILAASSPTVALGYGAENHDGQQLLAVSSVAPFRPVTAAFFENRSVYFEGGMSGGPLLARTPSGESVVTGVVVAGAVDQSGGGIRALDSTAAQFIRTYAR